MDPTKIDTTYAELRDDDLLVAKDGAQWHVSGVVRVPSEGVGFHAVEFWLGDARTKVRAHHLTKPAGEPCTVWRITKHADDVKALKDGSTLPDPGASDSTSSPPVPEAGTPRPLPGVASPEENARRAALLAETFGHGEAVAAVLTTAPGTVVEVDVTAAEVDAARTATDDEPVEVPTFESMTDLEQRSHLYVLHGIFAQDVEDRIERMKLHVACHRDHAAHKIRGRHTPHVHTDTKAATA